MKIPVEILIGMRYTRAKQRNRMVSFIASISIAGIALGITALIVIISIMNGFQNELRGRILGSTEHIKISARHGHLAGWHELPAKIRTQPHVVGAAPYIQAEVMATNGQFVQGTMVKGIMPDEEHQVSDLGQHMVEGSIHDLRAGAFNIVMGEQLANRLNVQVGSEVTVISPFAMVTPAGMLPRVKRFHVVGTFRVSMHEIDNQLSMIHMRDAARFFRYGQDVSGIRVRLDDLFRAPAVAKSMEKAFGTLQVKPWTKENVAFFQALKVEKIVMTVILTLIIFVAVFNIVSMLVMMVSDKQGDIAILRTIGATPRSMMGIFMVQGSFVGVSGTVLGLIGGTLLALNIENLVPLIESVLGHKFFPEDIYTISEVPSQMQSADIFMIGIISLTLTVLATLYPAWQAANTRPAEVLRYDW